MPIPVPTTGNPQIDATLQQMAASADVEAQMAVYANSVPGWITDAVNKALAGGATAAQLAPLTDLAATLKTNADAAVAAMAATTPAQAKAALAKMKTP